MTTPSAPPAVPGALILVVEDQVEIAQILVAYLERAGFRTVTAADGDTALAHAAMLKPDLMLLDLKLPRRDGFSVLSTLRVESRLPVIVISALDDALDKLSALRIGADDYVTKPFNPPEVVARVEAVLRRAQPAAPGDLTRFGAITLDAAAHQVSVHGQTLELTLSEFRLLAHLLRRPGQAHSRATLLDSCLEESEALERTVDSHISHLRRKLQQAGAGVQLTTVRGVGYRLDAA